ncbi:MAG: hypothetical protein B7Y37_14235 [Sphingobacteriia bacterium 28-36-52]|nr:MAG: hypothetical protein B7Y37_14235 [Sphingobacteriia bacterium 28-36-52]
MLNKNQILSSIIFLMILFASSCDSTRRITSPKKQLEEIYLDQFKLTYLRQLLRKSYNNSNAVQEIIVTDNSGFTEPFLTANDLHIIDSLTTIDNEYLKVDSTQGIRRAEGANGKRPLGFIMKKLTSKWLDSLAKRRLKISGVSDSWSD